MFFYIQLVLSGQLEGILDGPAIVEAVRGCDVPCPLVEALLLGAKLLVGGGGGGFVIVDVPDALVETTFLIVVVLLIETFLGGQNGLYGTVLVDHLLFEIFGRAKMFQSSDAVLGFALIFGFEIHQALLMLVKVAVGIFSVKHADCQHGLLDRLADALVVVLGVAGERGCLLGRWRDDDESCGRFEADGLIDVLDGGAVDAEVGTLRLDDWASHDG